MLRPADKISEHGGNISREDSLLAGGGKAFRSKTRTPAKKASVGNSSTLKTLPSLGEQAEKIRGQMPSNDEQDVKQMSETDGSLRVNDGGCVIYPL